MRNNQPVTSGELWTAQELVEPKSVTVEYGGKPVQLTTGRPLVHAVRGDVMSALCGTARRRLLPMGQPWDGDLPGHVERCSTCRDVLRSKG